MKIKARHYWLLALLALSGPLSAEVVLIPVGAQSYQGQHLPNRGMSKQQVLEQFGAALRKDQAKGVPPISQWHYETFSVYFESDTVIHSVAKFKRQALPLEERSKQ